MLTRPNDEELHEFLTRGVAEIITRDELAAALRRADRPLRIKQGFDPTRPNLHIGHAIGLRKLRTLARWGHEIVIIIGDYTTQIGDPTDKSESRPMISHEQVLENARTYLEQFHRIVPRENTRVVYQAEWYGAFGLKDVFRLASRFTVQQMLAREEFRKRQAAGTAIPIKDLLYPLLQAYDSVAIEAEVEFGGTDQKFNILAGRELQEEVGQRPQQVFLVQMLEGTDGLVMSKTKPQTAVWLLDPPDEAFGKVMSIPDAVMAHYFEWATEMPLPEVRRIVDALARGELHPREAKEVLARRIVTELHSAAAADEAATEFVRRFRERQMPDVSEIPVVTVSKDGEHAVPIVDLLVRAKLQPSRGSARRLVQQKAVRVDDVLADESTIVTTAAEHIVRYGPRSYARIRWSV
ncbi:MAG: tyrosine--tRNA ligase [Chloroflexota bacterium]|nr:tyrosine--tRNA ligase [Chloroflexota bacterium]